MVELTDAATEQGRGKSGADIEYFRCSPSYELGTQTLQTATEAEITC
jgi:hypothetical protein